MKIITELSWRLREPCEALGTVPANIHAVTTTTVILYRGLYEVLQSQMPLGRQSMSEVEHVWQTEAPACLPKPVLLTLEGAHESPGSLVRMPTVIYQIFS